jgi:hypothetical protein
MCSQCDDLDRKISRYREIATAALDALTVQRIKELIRDLEQQRAAMQHV